MFSTCLQKLLSATETTQTHIHFVNAFDKIRVRQDGIYGIETTVTYNNF